MKTTVLYSDQITEATNRVQVVIKKSNFSNIKQTPLLKNAAIEGAVETFSYLVRTSITL